MKPEGAGTASSWTVQPAHALAPHLASARAPYAILAGIQLGGAAVCLAFALPGTQYSNSLSIFLTLSVILCASSALTWFVAPRLPRQVGIDLGLYAGAVVAGIATWVTPTAEGQVLIALGLSVYAVLAAYFLPRGWRLVVALVVILGCYAVGVLLSPRLSGPAVLLLEAVAIVGVAALVSRLVTQLRELALHDGLTRLLNRRGLDLLAPPLLAAAARTGTPVTVGILDFDNFKRFNDAYGHLSGDELLGRAAARWTSVLRDSDLGVRFGGDEFAFVLVGADVASAHEIEARVAALGPLMPDAPEFAWTAGWSLLGAGESIYTALARADGLLLQAKARRHSGRD